MTTWRLLKGVKPYDKQAMYEIYSIMDLPATAISGVEHRAISQHTDAWCLYEAAGRRLGLTGIETSAIIRDRLKTEFGRLPSCEDWYRTGVEWRAWHRFDRRAVLGACRKEFTADVDPVADKIIHLVSNVPACVLQHSLGPFLVEKALGPWMGGFPVRCVAETVVETVRVGVPSPGWYTSPIRHRLPDFAKRVAAHGP